MFELELRFGGGHFCRVVVVMLVVVVVLDGVDVTIRGFLYLLLHYALCSSGHIACANGCYHITPTDMLVTSG
jgi:hypothetical protein